MSLSKRQQARNEKALQDLIKSVPGNDVCADCLANHPGWASWSLGIFLCMRCAAIHRKMGTHISKVKSLSMDSWTNEQVAVMKRMGNQESNRIFNPDSAKPAIPIDADEADAAMERFIRQKYVSKTASPAPQQTRHFSGSSSEDGPPPPLPPKTSSRFGFRSASSIFPLGNKNRSSITSPIETSSPRDRASKQSKLLGAHVGPDDLESKLSRLHEMGFTDKSRNAAVLKGLDGNMTRTIETLARLGDSGPVKKVEKESMASAGISIERELPKSPVLSVTPTTNPWESLDSQLAIPIPQSSQSTGGNPQIQPTTNPFGFVTAQTSQSLHGALQDLTLNNSQRLFPNHTGGFPVQQPPQPVPQTMTPPIPSTYYNYSPVIYENQVQQMPTSTPSQGFNPFMQSQPQPQAHQTSMFDHTPQTNPYHNPITGTPQFPPQRQVFQDTGFFMNQTTMQSPSNPFSASSAPQQQISPTSQHNPYNLSNPVSNAQQQHMSSRQQSMPLLSQPTGRINNQSILNLYNKSPQPIPQQGLGLFQESQNMQQAPEHSFAPPIRSFSSPLATHMEVNRNPFMSNATTMMTSPEINTSSNGMMPQNTRHISRESMAIDVGGWQNGRHSPDAWGRIAGSSR